jgi:hypothetical protein
LVYAQPSSSCSTHIAMFLHFSKFHDVYSISVNYFLCNHLLFYVYLITHYLKMLSATPTALGMINECCDWRSREKVGWWTEFRLL